MLVGRRLQLRSWLSCLVKMSQESHCQDSVPGCSCHGQESEGAPVSVSSGRKSGHDLVLSYLPEFVAKTESPSNPIPRTFILKPLVDFAHNLENELLLCPVRALKIYLERT